MYLAPICPSPKVIQNATITRAQDYDYIGQIVTYTCEPGFEFTEEDQHPVNVTEYIREDHSKPYFILLSYFSMILISVKVSGDIYSAEFPVKNILSRNLTETLGNFWLTPNMQEGEVKEFMMDLRQTISVNRNTVLS